jgi:dihydrofolate synthase/folylpolyglutamate synthase
MNYQETIAYLYARLPMFSRQGAAAYRADLHNIRLLCAALDHPEKKLRTIHVAGTNGKGSVSHMLASVLQSSGFKTGLYTSPHLQDFRERIKINGAWVSQEFVTRFTEKCFPLVDQIQPSFFELTVAMAFEWFAENRVDIAVIETGLGGRLDSTNIILPELSVITNIGWDHMQILGDTLPLIAAEKAGIIKPGVPVVIGETQAETRDVFIRKAAESGSPLVFADQVRSLNDWSWDDGYLRVTINDSHHADSREYLLDLPGYYQTKNLLTVLESIHQLQQAGWNISREALLDGLKHARRQTGLQGRWETLHRKPLLIADVAHNPDGMKQVTGQLEWMKYRHLHMVLGMVKDKDVEKVLALLPTTARYYFTQASVPRALASDQLQALALPHNLAGTAYPDLHSALQAAADNAHEDDMILVCGSVFLVGEVDVDKIRFSGR